jgi:hypothetical protein
MRVHPILAPVAALAVAITTYPARVPAQAVTGSVFLDRNQDGRRNAGEAGARGVAVSNQVDVVLTDSLGAFTLPNRGTGVVFVSVPSGSRATTRYWQRADGQSLAFGLTTASAPGEVTFLHASDTHIQASAVPRFDRLRAIIDSVKPAFVIITGDLIRDALRVNEAEATGYYDLFVRESGRIQVPVWTVPGNHELFGIERDRSGVRADHPLYARGMYHKYLGPDYYSFNAGGVHFVGLNTADISDQWYYGHVDSTQLRWLERDAWRSCRLTSPLSRSTTFRWPPRRRHCGESTRHRPPRRSSASTGKTTSGMWCRTWPRY